jgi:uncharacterized membrane protein YkoI
VFPILTFAAASVAVLVQTQAPAPERSACLSHAEQRAAIAEGRVIPLAAAKRILRQRMPGELLRARLCSGSGRLIYMLTVLTHDGKVRHVTVDATNGMVIGGL